MPHSRTSVTRNASLERNTDPMLCWLRTLSSTTTNGIFSASRNSSMLIRFSSSIFNFRLCIQLYFRNYRRGYYSLNVHVVTINGVYHGHFFIIYTPYLISELFKKRSSL